MGMFAITGITGQVGGEVARNLLAAHRTVRGVVRDVSKCKAWAERGCQLVSADINDAAALTDAFKDVDGVFILVPPNFDPSSRRVRVKSYICRRSGHRQRAQTCWHSTPSSSKRCESCRWQSPFCGQHGSWRTSHGMLLQRRTARFKASCSLWINQNLWLPLPTSGA